MQMEERQKRTKAKMRKLKPFLEEVPEEKKYLAQLTIDEIAFLMITLEDLKEKVMRDGVVTEMDQGKYTIDRENPALKSYNVTIQRYNSNLKLLAELIGQSEPKTENERDLRAFVARKL